MHSSEHGIPLGPTRRMSRVYWVVVVESLGDVEVLWLLKHEALSTYFVCVLEAQVSNESPETWLQQKSKEPTKDKKRSTVI